MAVVLGGMAPHNVHALIREPASVLWWRHIGFEGRLRCKSVDFEMRNGSGLSRWAHYNPDGPHKWKRERELVGWWCDRLRLMLLALRVEEGASSDGKDERNGFSPRASRGNGALPTL